MKIKEVHGEAGHHGFHAPKHVVLEREQDCDPVKVLVSTPVLVNLSKLLPVMMVHVQFGPTGRAGRIVLLNVMVALEHENEDV